MDLEVPELVLQRARSNGEAGQAWLDSLPDVLVQLTATWGLQLGAVFNGGTAGYVAAATDGAGEPRVLKVAMPLNADEHATFLQSVRVHQIANGRGCAQLLAFDTDTHAMLLEQLGPNLADLAMSVPQMLETIARTLQSFWQPLGPEAVEFPTGPDKTRWLANYIVASWTELGEPCSRKVIDQAVSFCEDRAAAFDPANAVLVHGDAHGWNTLQAADGQFKFVDPEGVWSEPAHDLAVPMREYNDPLLAGDTARLTRERAEHLAGLCEVDPDAVWQWGFIERVSTGLANLRDFDNDEGAAFLEVAERCL